ncbi:hypothetical protein COE51_01365 [Bacillus pseudomycoides]|nr:hypothetical protein COE51_01365 [Bacillus pseudomycoides]
METHNYIKLKNITQMCYACPTSFDGKTVDGKWFYCRYRGGQMRFEIEGKVILRCEYGEMYDGLCDWEEFKEQARDNKLIIDDSEVEWLE